MNIIETFTSRQIKDLHTLYQKEWWTKDRTLTETELCVKGSQLSIGVIDNENNLIGFARVLTDFTIKALIFDIIVSENYRNKNLGSTLIYAIKTHPTLNRIKHFELYCLPDMFLFYEQHGFSADVGDIKLMRCSS